jgi:hypothetical protein
VIPITKIHYKYYIRVACTFRYYNCTLVHNEFYIYRGGLCSRNITHTWTVSVSNVLVSKYIVIFDLVSIIINDLYIICTAPSKHVIFSSVYAGSVYNMASALQG